MSEARNALQEWREGIEERAKGRQRAIRRGTRRGPAVVAGAWRCEGQWQCDDQMDIWQCLDEVELDEQREHGNDEEGEE